jgi:hypothetical protein
MSEEHVSPQQVERAFLERGYDRENEWYRPGLCVGLDTPQDVYNMLALLAANGSSWACEVRDDILHSLKLGGRARGAPRP